ncbi:phage antirepressor KilAC domain-containing protein [Paenibacillus sp. NPDC101420]|uniref:phage antirepressor KilAC domain-containing protein n=1 Tax=Paenibacillus sp. NPDC101420 TaxID=3390602 RepID=UPI003D0953EA
MKQLQVFNFSGKEVRVIMHDGQPWWVAKDVCTAIDVDQTQTRRLDEDEKGLRSIQTLGGDQVMLTVNEPGLYSLILGSRKPEAKPFKRWITHDVLPAIRRTGMYAADELLENPDLLIQAATKLKEERVARRALEAKVEEDRPKVVFAEALEVSNDSVLIADLAKILKQNGINIGEIRLFKELRERGYLIKSGSEYNMPTQRSMQLQIMEIKVGQRGSASEGMKVTRTPKITGKGIGYFINKYKGDLS